MSTKKVLGKGLKSLLNENNKETIKGFNFNHKNSKVNLYINETNKDKYQIVK